MTGERNETRVGRFRLSQEIVASVTVGVALAGLVLATVGDLRDEARADRAAAQADRAAAQADRARGKPKAGNSATKPAPTAKTSSAEWKHCNAKSSG